MQKASKSLDVIYAHCIDIQMIGKMTNREIRTARRKILKKVHATTNKPNLIRVGVEVEVRFETTARRLFTVATAVAVSLMAWLLPWSTKIH
jgi:hypothetical protein